MVVRLPVLRGAYLCVSRCRSSTTAVTSAVLVTATRPASSSSGRRVGPDMVMPSNTLTCTVPGGAAEIRTDHDHPVVKLPAISVWTMLQQTVDKVPDNTAMAVKRNGVWVKWTYREYQAGMRPSQDI